nr:unnamed protein product [Digitaria exilis]
MHSLRLVTSSGPSRSLRVGDAVPLDVAWQGYRRSSHATAAAAHNSNTIHTLPPPASRGGRGSRLKKDGDSRSRGDEAVSTHGTAGSTPSASGQHGSARSHHPKSMRLCLCSRAQETTVGPTSSAAPPLPEPPQEGRSGAVASARRQIRCRSHRIRSWQYRIEPHRRRHRHHRPPTPPWRR